jgi:hypothetical protein
VKKKQSNLLSQNLEETGTSEFQKQQNGLLTIQIPVTSPT